MSAANGNAPGKAGGPTGAQRKRNAGNHLNRLGTDGDSIRQFSANVHLARGESAMRTENQDRLWRKARALARRIGRATTRATRAAAVHRWARAVIAALDA